MGSTLFLINGKEQLISHGEFIACFKCQKLFNWSHLFNCLSEPIPIEKVTCTKCQKVSRSKTIKPKRLQSKVTSGTAKQRKITEYPTVTSHETAGELKDSNQGAWQTLLTKCFSKQIQN